MALTGSARQAIWTRHLLFPLRVVQEGAAILVYENNRGASLLNSSVNYSRAKRVLVARSCT